MSLQRKGILLWSLAAIAAVTAIIFLTINKWYVLLFAIPICAASVVNILFIIIKSHFSVQELKEHHDLAGFIVTTLGALFGVIVAFTIVNAQDHTSKLRTIANKEAYLAADLFKISQGLPVIKNEVHEKLSEYLKSVVTQEWALMPEQEENPTTLKKLASLWDVYYSYKPQTTNEEVWLSKNLETLVNLNNARLQRVYESWEYLDILSWLALVVGGTIMGFFLFCFGSKNTGFQIAINSAYIFLIVFLFIITFLFNRPFLPPIKISPESYAVVYNYYNANSLISPEKENLLQTGVYKDY